MPDSAPLSLDIDLPSKLVHALMAATNRYIVLYGGRGSGKSWGAALSLLIKTMTAPPDKPIRILCTREFMSSIGGSVHKLLSDQIHRMGLDRFYTVEKSAIYHINGSEFRFAGIRNNPSELKSYEGIDVCWVEEAQNVSRRSWETLIPTIRKAGSQFLICFNPYLESDETYQRFVVHPPPDCLRVPINYDDNPYVPQAIVEEAEFLRKTDPVAFNNVYLGYPKVFLDNAVWGPELTLMQSEGRMTHVPYDLHAPVHTFWDLGWRDFTSIIFAQLIGFEYHIIDFVEGSQTSTAAWLRLLQQKPYQYGTDFLPHDAESGSQAAGKSIAAIMRQNGRKVVVLDRTRSVTHDIEYARSVFPRLYIDQAKCGDLIQHLRKYRWDIRQDLDVDQPDKRVRQNKHPEPLHDDNSHAADAFRTLCVSLRPPKAPVVVRTAQAPLVASGWMR